MRFEPLSIAGTYTVTLEPKEDERGFFARTFCRDELLTHGLDPLVAQANISFTKQKGTIRGMHFQTSPHEEQKLVRCIGGSVFDVVIDLRKNSPTFKQWTAVELTSKNRVMMLVPKGCAHGFETLEDDCEVLYLVSTSFAPSSDSGVRFDDPAFKIRWPIPVTVVSVKDQSFLDFQ